MIPAQSIEAERIILGSILIERGAFDLALEVITHPEIFYDERHRQIFAAMLSLQSSGRMIDVITLTERLKSENKLNSAGGAVYVLHLTKDVSSSAHLQQHCHIVYEKYMAREASKTCHETIAKIGSNEDIFDVIDEMERDLSKLGLGISNEAEHVGQLGIDSIMEIDTLRENPELSLGVKSGFNSLDRITNGWQKTDLIILGARPGVGKSAFALNIALHAALNGTSAAFFSLEMGKSQLVKRIISNISSVELDKIIKGKMSDFEYESVLKSVEKIQSIPIYIDDTSALNHLQLRRKARKLVNRFGVGLIIIDYLQLMGSIGNNKNRNRENDISEISRSLKILAKDLDIPIIALSQLSREVEKRSGKRPQLSDIRESGSIEQDADMVMFLHRLGAGKSEEEIMEIKSNGLDPNTTTLIISKHRNGSCGEIKLTSKYEFQRFEEEDFQDFKFKQLNENTQYF